MPSLDEILGRQASVPAIPVTPYPSTRIIPKKLLIVLSFWDGDHDMMASLCKLIADLQDGRCKDADVMLYRRNDARPMEADVKAKLAAKFDSIHEAFCRRLNAKGYPYGPNEMFYDLIEFFRGQTWRDKYYAFLNMEADCVPMSPDWISRLIAEWRQQTGDGTVFAMGHIYSFTSEPDHLNGAAMYSMDFFERAGGMEILGGPGSIAYDFFHAKRILPIARDTALMAMDFNRKTITAADLFGFTKLGETPVYLHGVKDLSAQAAVRSRFIDKSGSSDLSFKTIATYFDPPKGADFTEEQACLDVWKDAWKTAGWNPIVNNRWDASRHEKYKKDMTDRELQMLAMDRMGGGIYCDYEVLPRNGFSPERMIRDVGVTELGEDWCMFMADRPGIASLRVGYDHASNMIVKDVGSEGWGAANIVRFSKPACAAYSPGSPRSRTMIHFYRARQ